MKADLDGVWRLGLLVFSWKAYRACTPPRGKPSILAVKPAGLISLKGELCQSRHAIRHLIRGCRSARPVSKDWPGSSFSDPDHGEPRYRRLTQNDGSEISGGLCLTANGIRFQDVRRRLWRRFPRRQSGGTTSIPLDIPVVKMSLMFGDSNTPLATQSAEDLVTEALSSVRELLGMEVAFVSEFSEGRRVFRFIDADEDFCPIKVNGSDPLEESYCQRVIDGRLPEVIPDATQNVEALTLAATRALPVGAHVSVPIRFSSGQVLGTFCCFSRTPDFSLGQRDLAIMKLFAGFVSKVLEERDAAERANRLVAQRLGDVLENQRFDTVYQPIFDLNRQKVAGFEALVRFRHEPYRPPNEWIEEAVGVGLQKELEHAILRRALKRLQDLPDDVFLSLNVAPATVLEGSIAEVLEGHPLGRIVLEITEHQSVSDYARIAVELEPLRTQGMRIAVDDAGAGYASFRHILNLRPDIIKLDASLIQNIDSGVASRALAAALVRFAEETGCQVVAEGVETEAELNTLRELKVSNVQGFLLGRPKPAEGYPLFSA